MDITALNNDTAILSELGFRLSRIRVQRNLTQAHLAEQAGISKPTLERIEAGHDAQLSSMIRLLRALDLLDVLDQTLPLPKPSPMERLKIKGKERKRASTPQQKTGGSKPWTWGDEA